MEMSATEVKGQTYYVNLEYEETLVKIRKSSDWWVNRLMIRIRKSRNYKEPSLHTNL